MPAIHFKTKLFNIAGWTILQLPEEASAKLPSRGQVMVKGTINGHGFQHVLEPDGKWSHWFRVDKNLKKASGAEEGDSVELSIEPTKDWPEPNIPDDLKAALTDHPKVQTLWANITPMARWDWIRWINGTKNPDTRKHRIAVSLSKLNAGEKRPCCFNRSMCTDPHVSRNGKLLDPTEAKS
jgi:hypothetical protein